MLVKKLQMAFLRMCVCARYEMLALSSYRLLDRRLCYGRGWQP